MRQVSEAFAARLAADDTSLCACWRLQRADGEVFGATDHDREIPFGGVTYLPAHGLAGAVLESSSGLAPGRAAAGGVLDAAFITEGDLAAGLWDRARVDVWRVDWRDPTHRVRVWSGRLSEVTREGAAFRAELVSLKADLELPVGRVYQRGCDAEIGDARCGVDLTASAFRGDGVIEEAVGWSTGANAGAVARVVRHDAGVDVELELAAAPRFAIEVGDAFVVTAGCDKSFAMCGARFANQDNFRGFPHMPGNDAVLSGPSWLHANDGGSRS
jgi:hypothetical protein